MDGTGRDGMGRRGEETRGEETRRDEVEGKGRVARRGAPGERVEQLRRVGHEVLDGEEEERLGVGDARHRPHAHRALPLRHDAQRVLYPTLRAENRPVAIN